jgi:predicted nucleic acid-binding protein
LYFDTAYGGKCYLNEPDSRDVRDLASSSEDMSCSASSIAEFACEIHRKVREGTLTQKSAATLQGYFLEDIRDDTWLLIPVSDRILRQVELLTRSSPKSTPLRTGDAIHIVSAVEAGFNEIWTNDRHLLAAAAHFGLKGAHPPQANQLSV